MRLQPLGQTIAFTQLAAATRSPFGGERAIGEMMGEARVEFVAQNIMLVNVRATNTAV